MPDAASWDNMDRWHQTLPPNRPDRRNLDLLRASLGSRGKKKHLKAAILGCTPEYRAILRECFEEVYLFDQSKIFKQLSDEIVGVKNNEKFIEGNWLETLNNHKHQFDFICSHFTHGNLPFEKRDTFFSVVSNSLNPDGLFFDTIFDLQHPWPAEWLSFRFAEKPMNLETANELNALAVFQGEYIDKTRVVDTSEAYNWMDTNFEGMHLKQLVEYTKRITPPGLVWHYAVGRGPSTLSYDDYFNCDTKISEVPENAFWLNSYVSISKRRAL